MSVSAFTADLKLLAKTLDVNIMTVTQLTVQSLWNKITMRTPVDTGRARAGWGLAVGSASVDTPAPGEYPPKEQAPAPLPDLSVIDGKQAVYLLNNVAYVQYLEQGSSKQAPAGMVVLSIAEVELDVEQQLRSRGVI